MAQDIMLAPKYVATDTLSKQAARFICRKLLNRYKTLR